MKISKIRVNSTAAPILTIRSQPGKSEPGILMLVANKANRVRKAYTKKCQPG